MAGGIDSIPGPLKRLQIRAQGLPSLAVVRIYIALEINSRLFQDRPLVVPFEDVLLL